MTVPLSKAGAPSRPSSGRSPISHANFLHDLLWNDVPQRNQVGSTLPFVCALPVLPGAALWCSQQLTLFSRAATSRLGVLKHTSWRLGSRIRRNKTAILRSAELLCLRVPGEGSLVLWLSAQRIAYSTGAGEERGCHIVKNNYISRVNTCTAATTD